MSDPGIPWCPGRDGALGAAQDRSRAGTQPRDTRSCLGQGWAPAGAAAAVMLQEGQGALGTGMERQPPRVKSGGIVELPVVGMGRDLKAHPISLNHSAPCPGGPGGCLGRRAVPGRSRLCTGISLELGGTTGRGHSSSCRCKEQIFLGRGRNLKDSCSQWE